MRRDRQALVRGDQAPVRGQAADLVAIVGEELRPGCKNLPRTDRVELFDVVEQHDPDVLRHDLSLAERAPDHEPVST
jgi:hypothetical protein